MSKTRWSSRQFLLSSLRFRCWIGYLVSYSNIYARQLSYILKLLVCRWDCTNHNVTLCSAHTESVREGYSSVLESFHFLERLSLRSDGKKTFGWYRITCAQALWDCVARSNLLISHINQQRKNWPAARPFLKCMHVTFTLRFYHIIYDRSIRRADVCDLVRANILPHGSVFFDGYAFRKQEQQQQQQNYRLLLLLLLQQPHNMKMTQ